MDCCSCQETLFTNFVLFGCAKVAIRQHGIAHVQVCSFLSTQKLFLFWPSCYHGRPVGSHHPPLKIKFPPPWLSRTQGPAHIPQARDCSRAAAANLTTCFLSTQLLSRNCVGFSSPQPLLVAPLSPSCTSGEAGEGEQEGAAGDRKGKVRLWTC